MLCYIFAASIGLLGAGIFTLYAYVYKDIECMVGAALMYAFSAYILWRVGYICWLKKHAPVADLSTEHNLPVVVGVRVEV